MDLAGHKKRLQMMLAVVGVAFVVAMAMILISVRTHSSLATAGFVVALLTGFGAQAWMIWSWKKAEARQAGGKA
ncbi:MAG: hypothetical protein JWM33_3910 [Caulobacteraceae bacterium]|nr:hypothetical protein [Caulobacteraceae bacterium]